MIDLDAIDLVLDILAMKGDAHTEIALHEKVRARGIPMEHVADAVRQGWVVHDAAAGTYAITKAGVGALASGRDRTRRRPAQHPTLPWWRREWLGRPPAGVGPGGRMTRWRRSDGLPGPEYFVHDGDDDAAKIGEVLADLDAHHPRADGPAPAH